MDCGGDLPRSVRASAPAKVLLFGEHAVVYGCPSIAVALTDLRLTVTIDQVNEHDAGVEFIFEDIRDATTAHQSGGSAAILRRRYLLSGLQEISQSYPSDESYLPRPSDEVLARIEALIASESIDHIKTLRPCLFLVCALGRSSLWSNTLRIRVSAGSFPIGAGLGSSAALSVALAGALSKVSGDSPFERVNQFAFAAETILHGTPSGVDNTVSTFGGALQFYKLPSPRYERIASDFSKFRFLVVNTKVPRSTKDLVAGVRRRYDANPDETQQAFDAIERIVDEFVALGASNTLTESILGGLMARNQEVLNGLGVGHISIDEVVRICASRGIWTKLTGAGGGGCTVSLVPHSLSQEDLDGVVQELEAKGYPCFLSALGGHGLHIKSS